MKVTRYEFSPRPGQQLYEIVTVAAGRCAAATEVQITESPTGRSVQVHVNGKRVR